MTIENITTVSEIQQFLRCREQWDIMASSRRALVRVGAPPTALHLGSLVHYGLETNIKGGDWKKGLLEKAGKQRVELEGQYREVVGVGWSTVEVDQFNDVVSRAWDILVVYFDKWGSANPLAASGPFRYLPKTCELTFKVPLPGLPNTYLGGTFDCLALDEAGNVWAVDHKTYSQKPSNKDFTLSFQFMSYMWALTMLFGPERIGGCIYDGISTKLPDEPAVLGSGRLSQNKSCKTTGAIYRRAIARLGQKEEDYKDFLAYLDAQNAGDQTEFHWRQIIPFNARAIALHQETLVGIVRDMFSAPTIYPNLRWEGCWDCRVQDLCHAKLQGEDVDEVMKRYVHRPATYGTTRALLDPTKAITVGKLEDLL